MNVLIGDSRVLNVKRSRAKSKCKKVEDFWGRAGGGFNTCRSLVEDHIIYHHPPLTNERTHYYIFTGICDITKKLSGRNYQEVIYVNDGSLMDNIKNKITTLEKFIFDQGAVPIFCTIPSMQIQVWNEHRLASNKTSSLVYQESYYQMQIDLELTIDHINDFLTKCNLNNGVATPLTHTALFRQKHGKRFILHKCLHDGCHPDDYTIGKIITSLNRAILQNNHLH